MIGFKGTQDISTLMANTIRKNDIENAGLDLRALTAEGGSKEDKIKRIAVQFEEMLINTLLKETYKEEPDEEGLPLSTSGYTDMRRMFLSQYVADNGGLGYRETIEEQLKQQIMDGGDSTKTAASGRSAASQAFSLSTVRTAPHLPQIPNVPAVSKPLSNPGKVSDPVNAPISSNYGWRKDPIDGKTRFHAGADFEVPRGTPVKSFMAGEVTYSGWEKGYGYLVEVEHPSGFVSRYGHNSKLLVKKGDRVESGAVVSLSGSSGRSTGPHLHFEVRKGEFSLDPVKILDPMNRGVLAKK